MEKPVLVLHRKSANLPEVKDAVKFVRQSGIDLQVRVPWNKKDKKTIIRELLKQGHRRFVVGGGDGTLNAAANAIMKSKRYDSAIEMGILPLGTANDMANGLGLPRDDLRECLRIACSRESRPMDVGVMNKQYFVNVASGGFGAEVTATTPQDLKNRLGGAAYTLNGLLKLWQMKPYTGTLQIEDAEPITGSMLLMVVGNNRLAGGGFVVAPMAVPDDGLLDLMIVLGDVIPDPTKLLAEIKDPMGKDNRLIRYVQVKHFRLEADRPLHMNLDGEPVLAEKLTFSVKPGALRVVY